ncbi:hypothetical protein, partial [Rufibacter immobilis]|uniref:hypothetical protein n=1 Tax=Rufibacter immobilis TaxID=1348778 RepID=UPI001C8404F5
QGGKVLEARAKLFNELPASLVQKVDAFFLGRWFLLEAASKAYSQAVSQHQESVENFLTITTKNGTGRGWRSALRRKLQRFILYITSKRAKYLAGRSTRLTSIK